MRLLSTIGGVDFTGQERAALNKLTVSMISLPVEECERNLVGN